MGLTIALVDSGEGQIGDLRYQVADVTFDSSYPTGGELLPTGNGSTPSVGSVSNVLGAAVWGVKDATSAGVVIRYVPSTGKLMCLRTGAFTGTGSVTGTAAGQVFSGSALAAHGHVLHFQTSAAANAVTAAANQLRTAAAAFDVASVANASGEGGIVQITAGTPAGTNAASALTATFTADAQAQAALAEVTAATSLATVQQRLIFYGI